MEKTFGTRITEEVPVKSPEEMRQEVPLTPKARKNILTGRNTIELIKRRKNHRLLVLVGPCSIHSEKGADEFAEKLIALTPDMPNIFPVMRFYIDKPRTNGHDWKGLANDPYLDGSCDIEEGIRRSRRMIIRYAEKGLIVVTEFVDPLLVKYFKDIVGMPTIGARTSSSQPHQIFASGLPAPYGIKHDIYGNLDSAVSAIAKAASGHTLLSTTDTGGYSKKTTAGNPLGFMIMRGGDEPNYYAEDIAIAKRLLESAGLTDEIIVDCSHGNSLKMQENQPTVWYNVMKQKLNGDTSVVGLMLEAYLKAGKQKLVLGEKPAYDISVTDACAPWETAKELLLYANDVMGLIFSNQWKKVAVNFA